MANTLCNGLIPNNNPKSPIQYFELVTAREFNDCYGGTYIDQITNAEQFLVSEEESVDEPFYQIYGKRYIDDKRSGTIFLGEFYCLNKAKEFLYNLTGEYPYIISY